MVTIIVLGATGDLAQKKLFPAIYNLVVKKKVANFAVVGVARRATTMEKLWKAARKNSRGFERKTFDRVVKRSYYVPVDFEKPEDYARLNQEVEKIEKKHRLKGDRLFYLATSPEFFDTITHKLAGSGIGRRRKRCWSRVVYEKPFGHDLKSARKINKCISRVFREDQIYRIDHYLGKELVGGISLVRFTNRVLEPLWNREHVESVQILLSEDFGVEGRAGFYDKYGAIKDVVQNHALQLLALTAMEAPLLLTGEHVRDAKSEVLKKVSVSDVVLGQYKGYVGEEGVARGSRTETFAALRLEVDNSRWRGVPFFVKVGKYLGKREVSIHLKFKEVHCRLSKSCPSDTNYFTFMVQPDSGFVLEINGKVPGLTAVVPVKMNFCESCEFGANSAAAYEILLEDVIRGDQSVFVRHDEIEHSWQIVDKIQRRKVFTYSKGGRGPKELEAFERKHKMRWRG